MGRFIDTDHFTALNVGCALDEGLANDKQTGDKPSLTVFYGERAVFWLKVCTCACALSVTSSD